MSGPGGAQAISQSLSAAAAVAEREEVEMAVGRVEAGGQSQGGKKNVASAEDGNDDFEECTSVCSSVDFSSASSTLSTASASTAPTVIEVGDERQPLLDPDDDEDDDDDDEVEDEDEDVEEDELEERVSVHRSAAPAPAAPTPSASSAPTTGLRRCTSSLLQRSIRRLRLRAFSPPARGLSGGGFELRSRSPEPLDIVSLTIHCQMFHVTMRIFSHLDAVSLRTCEDVCQLWRQHIRQECIWRRSVQMTALEVPDLAKKNGWSSMLPAMGGKEPKKEKEFRKLYWKMTNLAQLWRSRTPYQVKHSIKRPDPIRWSFPRQSDGRCISVYNVGKGYIIKIHDNLSFKYRASHTVEHGTVKKDTLCVDSTERRIAVGGLVSMKVWVFNYREVRRHGTGPQGARTRLDQLLDSVMGYGPTYITIDLFKFINAGNGVTRVCLHKDDKRVAVLLPLNVVVEVWDVVTVTKLQSHEVPSDSTYMLWKGEQLLLASLFSGHIDLFDTSSTAAGGAVPRREKLSLEDCGLRRIEALAMYKRLCATGEGRTVKIWSLEHGHGLVSWTATKTFVSALLMNDVMLASGSDAGIVKLWDLKALLRKDVQTVGPLCRISMKSVLHYPIKGIFQFSYTDLLIVAKYEAKRKKDKIKWVKVDRAKIKGVKTVLHSAEDEDEDEYEDDCLRLD